MKAGGWQVDTVECGWQRVARSGGTHDITFEDDGFPSSVGQSFSNYRSFLFSKLCLHEEESEKMMVDHSNHECS